MLTTGKFIVASMDKTTGVLTPVMTPPPPPNPIEYATQAAAETAASDLAAKNPNNKYVVLSSVHIANINSTWE